MSHFNFWHKTLLAAFIVAVLSLAVWAYSTSTLGNVNVNGWLNMTNGNVSQVNTLGVKNVEVFGTAPIVVRSNVDASGKNVSAHWFKGLFNWIIKNDLSRGYLGFNGSDLKFNETKLNSTIHNNEHWVNESGDMMTGDLNMGNKNVTNVTLLKVKNIEGFSDIIVADNIVMSAYNVSAYWINAFYNWIIKPDFSVSYLQFNGSDLKINESKLNTTMNALINGAEPSLNVNSSMFANKSNYWDGLNTPANINAADITDDNTYVRVSGDSLTGNLNMLNHNITNVTSLWVKNVYGFSPITFIGNLVATGYNLSANKFFGLFNWSISSGLSSNYLSFNGATLTFGEAGLNNTISARSAQLNVNSSNFWDGLNSPANLQNKVLSSWANISGRPTHVLNLTDNIVYSIKNVNSSMFANQSNFWDGYNTPVNLNVNSSMFANQSNFWDNYNVEQWVDNAGDIMTGNLNLTSKNLTTTGSVCFVPDCSSRIYFNGTGIIISG